MFISGPVSSIPPSLSNEIPDDVMLNVKARGGDIGDFASLMNLFPTRGNENVESESGIREITILDFKKCHHCSHLIKNHYNLAVSGHIL